MRYIVLPKELVPGNLLVSYLVYKWGINHNGATVTVYEHVAF